MDARTGGMVSGVRDASGRRCAIRTGVSTRENDSREGRAKVYNSGCLRTSDGIIDEETPGLLQWTIFPVTIYQCTCHNTSLRSSLSMSRIRTRGMLRNSTDCFFRKSLAENETILLFI